MVTEADREARDAIVDKIESIIVQACAKANIAVTIEKTRTPWLLDILARHRTASTAALTAEIQRLRECLHAIDIEAGNTIPRDGKEAAFAALDRIIRLINPFRLSTPSEVSKPVSDHIGGEGEKPEPFGYWVEQKHAYPVLLRKPAYIPEPSPLRTVTPLYATLAKHGGAEALGDALKYDREHRDPTDIPRESERGE